MFFNIKNIKFLMLATALMGAAACERKKPDAEKKLYDDIMKIHDDVMPKMGDVNLLKQNILSYNKNMPVEGKNVLLKDTLISVALMLANADESMMQWMSDFNYPTQKRTDEESLVYLKSQKDSVNKLSNKIYLAIGMGSRMLKNAPDSLKVVLK